MIRKFLAASAIATSFLIGSTATHAATIDFAFALDESGSINAADFALATSGLANALSQIPTSGDDTFRISVVAFSTIARTIVPVTDVTADNIAGIQDAIRGIEQASQFTAVNRAIDLLTANFAEVVFGDTSLFNVTTDGNTNVNTLGESVVAATAAGLDGLSFETVLSGVIDPNRLVDLAFPGTPLLIDDVADIPNATETGFVLEVASFLDYEDAINAKVERFVADTTSPSPVPLPAGMPLILVGLAAFGGLRIKRNFAA